MFISSHSEKLLRIAVLYDGGFLRKVRNYYYFDHPRKANLSIRGIHEFIADQAAKAEDCNRKFCRVVESHYFSGRFTSYEATEDQRLAFSKVQDILVREGVVQHFLPMAQKHEKGIDVWLSIEALDLAVHKRFDIAALIAGDGDYVPLVRKLNGIGTRVMLLGWNFESTDEKGRPVTTRTSRELVRASTYPLMMSDIIDDPDWADPALINRMFEPSPGARVIGVVAGFSHDREWCYVETETGMEYRFVKDYFAGDFSELTEGVEVSFVPTRDGMVRDAQVEIEAKEADEVSADEK